MPSLKLVPGYMGSSDASAICINGFVTEEVSLMFHVALVRLFF